MAHKNLNNLRNQENFLYMYMYISLSTLLKICIVFKFPSIILSTFMLCYMCIRNTLHESQDV